MDLNSKVYIKSIDGLVLEYTKNDLANNPFIKSTLIEKVFFVEGFEAKSELVLQYNSQIVAYLVPFIREGIIYLSNIRKNTDTKLEVLNLLNYIAGENEFVAKIIPLISNGTMDLFGRIIYMDKIGVNDLFFLLPIDELEARSNLVPVGKHDQRKKLLELFKQKCSKHCCIEWHKIRMDTYEDMNHYFAPIAFCDRINYPPQLLGFNFDFGRNIYHF